MGSQDSDPAAGQRPGQPGGHATKPAGGHDDLLGEVKALRRQARAARHAYWFPLVLFGLLICGAVPFYVLPRPAGGSHIAQGGPPLPILGGFPSSTVQRYLGYYWLAALLGGLLLTLLWYRWSARRVGLQTPARGSALTVTVLTVLSLVIPLLSQVRSPHWLGWLHYLHVLWPGDLVLRGTFPFLIIAAGLWVLAWAERSPALAIIAAVYTGAALLSTLYNTENILFRAGWTPSGSGWSLTSLPNVLLPALVLLAAGAGAFAGQRSPHRAPA